MRTGAHTRLRRHPGGAFLLWTYLVGQPLVFVPVILRARGVDVPTQPFIVATTLVAVLLPAVVITRVVDGREAVRRLWSSAVSVRSGLGWYLFAFLAAPGLATALTFAFYGLPERSGAGEVVSAIVVGLLVQTLVALLTTNLWEEVGWMGFVQSRLQARHGALLAAVLTAPLFMLQHVSLLVDSVSVGAIVVLLAATLVMIPFRMTLAWVWNRTGSLFVVGLVHAAGNAVAVGSGFGLGILQRLYPGREVGSMHVLAFLLIGLALLVVTRGRLGGVRRGPLSGVAVPVRPVPSVDHVAPRS